MVSDSCVVCCLTISMPCEFKLSDQSVTQFPCLVASFTCHHHHFNSRPYSAGTQAGRSANHTMGALVKHRPLSCACNMWTWRRLTGEFFFPLTLNMIVISITQGPRNGFECKDMANECVTVLSIARRFYYVYRSFLSDMNAKNLHENIPPVYYGDNILDVHPLEAIPLDLDSDRGRFSYHRVVQVLRL